MLAGAMRKAEEAAGEQVDKEEEASRKETGKQATETAAAATMAAPAAARADDLSVGERVHVRLGKHRGMGTLRHVGLTRFAAGEWCGVEMDKPLGKNDDSMRDERRFTCEPRYGIFVRPVMLWRGPQTEDERTASEEVGKVADVAAAAATKGRGRTACDRGSRACARCNAADRG